MSDELLTAEIIKKQCNLCKWFVLSANKCLFDDVAGYQDVVAECNEFETIITKRVESLMPQRIAEAVANAKVEWTKEVIVEKPTTCDGVWHFKGTSEDKEVELLCISSDNGKGCHEVAHKYYDRWIPTTQTQGAKYLSYVDMKGQWQHFKGE